MGEPGEPHALPASVGSDTVHSIVPVAGSDHGQAPGPVAQAVLDGASAVLEQGSILGGLTVLPVALGLVIPELDATTESLAKQVPVGRVGTPEDIGALVVYLASDEAGWITGQTIHINGGVVTT